MYEESCSGDRTVNWMTKSQDSNNMELSGVPGPADIRLSWIYRLKNRLDLHLELLK